MSFRTTGLDPLVTFPYSSDITFLTPDDTGPLALVTNVTDLPLSGGTVPLQDFLRMLGPEGYDVRLNYTPADEISWSFQPDIPTNQASYVTLPYRPDGQPAQPGLYFLWIDTPQNYGRHPFARSLCPGHPGPTGTQPQGRGSGSDISMVLAVSNYQTTLKLSATEAFVWAVDLRTQCPRGKPAGRPVQRGGRAGRPRA